MKKILFLIIIISFLTNNAFAERKIKYWVEPMDPTYIRDKPGKSPMGMDLVPVYEDEDNQKQDKGTIKIDPNTIQNIGVRTSKVTKNTQNSTIRTVGNITYDEKRVKHIHTKVSGWVEKLFVNTTGEAVKKGQPILTIYSPELFATQNEYLSALKYKEKIGSSSFPEVAKGADTLLESTKLRLQLMDISESQIKELETNGKVNKDMTLNSPINGIVILKNVFEGMKIDSNLELYTIADISNVWVIASVYEYELPFLKIGQEANITLSYEPGKKYKGKVTFIYPFLDEKSRSVQVRIELNNSGFKLKPDMYANVEILSRTKQNAIVVPSEAVLRTGTRSVVIKEIDKGKYTPKEVTLGTEGEGSIQILAGLNEGDIIVTSGQFLIDSESKLKEVINKMLEAKKTESKVMTLPKTTLQLDKNQQSLVSNIVALYLQIHESLASDKADIVAKNAIKIEGIINQLSKTKHDKPIMDFISSIKAAIPGLSSGDIKKARDSFILLSKALVPYARGTGANDNSLKGTKIFVCTMSNERWIQLDGAVKNPFLGKEMLLCGEKEK